LAGAAPLSSHSGRQPCGWSHRHRDRRRRAETKAGRGRDMVVGTSGLEFLDQRTPKPGHPSAYRSFPRHGRASSNPPSAARRTRQPPRRAGCPSCHGPCRYCRRPCPWSRRSIGRVRPSTGAVTPRSRSSRQLHRPRPRRPKGGECYRLAPGTGLESAVRYCFQIAAAPQRRPFPVSPRPHDSSVVIYPGGKKQYEARRPPRA